MAKSVRYYVNGDGPLTVGALLDALEEIPREATVTVAEEDSQMDGLFWYLEALEMRK